jgi:hypothetical protein
MNGFGKKQAYSGFLNAKKNANESTRKYISIFYKKTKFIQPSNDVNRNKQSKNENCKNGK